MKNRSQSATLRDLLVDDWSRIVVMTGARQTGKTTLTRQATRAGDWRYFLLDDVQVAHALDAMTPAAWAKAFPRVVLDEVQKHPHLWHKVKAIHDSHPETRFILTGSAQLMLMGAVKETLAGRCHLMEMMPLTLLELQTNDWSDAIHESPFQSILKQGHVVEEPLPFSLMQRSADRREALAFYLAYGGYPALVRAGGTPAKRRRWLEDYVRTYLERDVMDIGDVRDQAAFRRALLHLAHASGELLVPSALAGRAGLQAATLKRFIRLLEMSYTAFVLPAWSKNPHKRLAKSGKTHFLDPGLLRALTGHEGPLTGPMLESAIVAEMFKQGRNAGVPARAFHHLRTSDGREIDCLIELPNGYCAYEIKSANRIRTTDARHLRQLDAILDKPILDAAVLSFDEDSRELEPGIFARPFAQFLA